MSKIFDSAMAGFTIGVLCTFFILMFNPFRYLFKTELLLMRSTLYNILIAPFGLVRFKHFFLADIFTSMVQVLKDLGYIGCFLMSGAWRNSEEPNMEKCPKLENYLLLIVLIPYWFRFAQCLKKYKDDPKKDKKTLMNAGKYLAVLMVQFANIFKHKFKESSTAFLLYVVMASISTSYSYCWDLYMDWGLLRSDLRKRKEPLFLRKTLRFPAWFYYQAALVNLCLRLTWTLPLLQFYMPQLMIA